MRSRPRRTRIRGLKAPAALLLLAALMLALTGTAIAKKDSTGSSTTTEGTATEETTSEETTAKKEKTSEETTTTEETVSEETTSEEGTTSEQTTTASAELNAQSLQLEPRVTTTGGGGQITCDPQGPKVDPLNAGGTDFITITDTVATVTNTFTFVWNGAATAGTWTSTFPFTGQIIVKSANNPASGSANTVYDYTNASSGAITSPAFNKEGQRQRISHIELCYEATGTRTVTVPVTATVDETVKKKKRGVAGEGAAEGAAAGAQAAEAVEARPGKGTLPFTGLHAPLLALVGLGTAIGGLAIRRALGDGG